MGKVFAPVVGDASTGLLDKVLMITQTRHGDIVWYEYPVRDKVDFEAQVTFYLMKQERRIKRKNIKFLNHVINELQIEIQNVTEDSPIEILVGIYWQLFVMGLLKIGYNRTHATGMKLFQISA